MAIKTQGTEFWAYHPVTRELLDLGCVTSIDGIDETLEDIETTCLRDGARTYTSGMSTPSSASFEVQFDPDNPDHIRLKQIKDSGATLQWLLGFRFEENGVMVTPGPAPEVDTATGEIVLPDERAWIAFSGYMSGFPFGFAQNDVVRSTIPIRISGSIDVIPRTPPADPTSVTVTPSTLSIAEGASDTISATVQPAGAIQRVVYTSSAPTIATVSQTGLVTGVAPGSATITATSTTDTSLSADCAVTVTAP